VGKFVIDNIVSTFRMLCASQYGIPYEDDRSLLEGLPKDRLRYIEGCKYIRHKNLRTTEIYLHSIDEGQRIAIDKIQGKFTSKIEYPHKESAHAKE
jgi:hypothetical protein